ncbi:DUF6714 family protein [uncultured Neptuniibacter sp.]|uniref:DUF6714 family protein n=1 Tax=uncultured Neptuniibacter sp. TaxID=502143 RepID=UPI0026051D4C|nr:DUF6714 family protein [uncultured Neptuniibacter sp.]
MDWVAKSRALFAVEKPEHFTNYEHCDECAEHDATLRQHDRESIGIEELGNPAWDPICFCQDIGMHYYLPAFIRLSLDTMSEDFYLEQFLFHLTIDGRENSFYVSCNRPQRRFIADFLAFLLEEFPDKIELAFCGDDLLNAYEIWSESES